MERYRKIFFLTWVTVWHSGDRDAGVNWKVKRRGKKKDCIKNKTSIRGMLHTCAQVPMHTDIEKTNILISINLNVLGVYYLVIGQCEL